MHINNSLKCRKHQGGLESKDCVATSKLGSKTKQQSKIFYEKEQNTQASKWNIYSKEERVNKGKFTDNQDVGIIRQKLKNNHVGFIKNIDKSCEAMDNFSKDIDSIKMNQIKILG